VAQTVRGLPPRVEARSSPGTARSSQGKPACQPVRDSAASGHSPSRPPHVTARRKPPPARSGAITLGRLLPLCGRCPLAGTPPALYRDATRRYRAVRYPPRRAGFPPPVSPGRSGCDLRYRRAHPAATTAAGMQGKRHLRAALPASAACAPASWRGEHVIPAGAQRRDEAAGRAALRLIRARACEPGSCPSMSRPHAPGRRGAVTVPRPRCGQRPRSRAEDAAGPHPACGARDRQCRSWPPPGRVKRPFLSAPACHISLALWPIRPSVLVADCVT
jgi:hypothetical protein